MGDGSLVVWQFFVGATAGSLILRRFVPLRNFSLLLASYCFYFALDVRFFWVLLYTTVVSYFFALFLARCHSRILLWIGITLLLCTLGYFKYVNFFLGNIAAAAAFFGVQLHPPTLELLFPLGISFYTFQAVGYLVDVFRKDIQSVRNPLHFALFLAFFPKIIAGPIERAASFIPQCSRMLPLTMKQFNEAAFLIVWGCVLKFSIADNAALIADPLFADPVGVESSLSGILAFTLQIFADFAGYSLMAKGAAALLGFDLSWNFHMPYIAHSPQDFWRRWHISLSEWFRDYVYIPLGGNRKGEARTLVNLMATMVLVGFWHGSTWMFVSWGAYHGVLLCAHRFLLKRNIALSPDRVINVGGTFLLVVFGWILFRSADPATAWEVLRGIADWSMDTNLHPVVLLWLPVVSMHILEIAYNDRYVIAHLPPAVRAIFYYLAFYMLLYLPPMTPQQFIYVQF